MFISVKLTLVEMTIIRITDGPHKNTSQQDILWWEFCIPSFFVINPHFTAYLLSKNKECVLESRFTNFRRAVYSIYTTTRQDITIAKVRMSSFSYDIHRMSIPVWYEAETSAFTSQMCLYAFTKCYCSAYLNMGAFKWTNFTPFYIGKHVCVASRCLWVLLFDISFRLRARVSSFACWLDAKPVGKRYQSSSIVQRVSCSQTKVFCSWKRHLPTMSSCPVFRRSVNRSWYKSMFKLPLNRNASPHIRRPRVLKKRATNRCCIPHQTRMFCYESVAFDIIINSNERSIILPFGIIDDDIVFSG